MLHFLFKLMRAIRHRWIRKNFLFFFCKFREQGKTSIHKNIKVGNNVGVYVEKDCSLVILSGVYLADGVKIHVAGLNREMSIGKNTRVQKSSVINGDVSIGNDAIISPNVLISSGKHLYNKYPGLSINAQDHKYRIENGESYCRPISIGDNVWIGMNCVILPGSKIGNNTVIGASSVVRGVVPADTVIPPCKFYDGVQHERNPL